MAGEQDTMYQPLDGFGESSCFLRYIPVTYVAIELDSRARVEDVTYPLGTSILSVLDVTEPKGEAHPYWVRNPYSSTLLPCTYSSLLLVSTTGTLSREREYNSVEGR